MQRTVAVGIQCPYCGETVEISVDCSVEHQRYIEDCQVCCRPMDITVAIDGDGEPSVAVSRDDDV
ncbi:MAG: CPXCG motif-containing cysteine-rich protein [Gammaproteobacteria bacterium]|nr:CPXCG motif-containing cysteine-rich protein [Gammaproteobacteria bacterium]